MRIFRVEYVRDGSTRHMTFAKRNEALALLYLIEILNHYITAIGGKDIRLV